MDKKMLTLYAEFLLVSGCIMLRSASWQESQDTYVLKPGNDTNIMRELEQVNLNSLSLSFLTHEMKL